jgi:uncharacterized protein YfaQ (DUF2300 family)
LPTISEGRIFLEDPVPAPPRAGVKTLAPAAPATPGAMAEQLQRHVQLACGGLARRVQVVPQGGEGLLVRVSVASAEQQEQVLKRLVVLPEMASAQVRLQVAVGN